jgi:hypothetical protein
MRHGTQESDVHVRPESARVQVREKQGGLTVAAAARRLSDEERSDYRLAARALLADIIIQYRSRDGGASECQNRD